MGFRTAISAEQYNTPIKGEAVVKVDGIDLQQYGFILTQYPDLAFPNKRNRYQTHNHHSGTRNYGGVYDNWTFELTGIIAGLSHNDLLKRLDEFKSVFMEDFSQWPNYEYILNAIGYHGHFFEISGHKHWYTTGTVSGTTTTITGTGTQWSKYIKPGAEIEFTGHTTKYYILNVISNTEIEITPTLSASISGVTYRVERKRYLLVNLEGEGAFSAFSNVGFLSQSKLGSSYPTKASNFYTTSLQLSTQVPYWLGDPFTHIETNLASGSFIDVSGIGNANISPIIRVVGAVNNPHITACEMGFHGLFHRTTRAVALKTVPSGDYIVTGALVSAKLSQGVDFVSGSLFKFDSMTDSSTPTGPIASHVNRNQGTFSGWFRVGFANTDTNTRILFTDNASLNPLTIRWNGASSRFEITDGTNIAFRDPSVFSANTWFNVTSSWGSQDVDSVTAGTQLLQIWVNGTVGTGAASYLTGTPHTTLSIGSDVNNANKYLGLIDDIAIWDTFLPQRDIDLLYNSGSGQYAGFTSITPLVYFPIDGTGNMSGTALGSTQTLNFPVSSTSATAATIANRGTKLIDNESIVVWDAMGYLLGGYINGSPTDSSITIDDGAGGNVTGLSQVGVHANLDGTNYFDGGNILDVTTGDVACSAWVKTTSVGQGTILAKSDGTGTAGYMLYLDSSGKANFQISNGTTTVSMVSTKVVNDGYWHHIGAAIVTAAISIGNELTIDGLRDQVATPTSAAISLTNALNFRIGSESDGDNKFVGQIRDVHFWGSGTTTFLSSGPVPRKAFVDLASNPLNAVTIGTQVEDGFWKFTDSTAGALGTDSSAVPKTLTPTGGPTRIQNGITLSTNLVADPSHENRNVGGFKQVGGWDPLPPTSDNLQVSTTTYHNNTRAILIKSDVTGQGLAKQAKVPKGKTIRITFWYQSDGNVAHGIVDRTTGTIYANVAPTLSSTLATGFIKIDRIIQIDNTGTNIHDLEIQFTGGTAYTIYLDDFHVTVSDMVDGECDTTTGWSQVGTLTTFTINTGTSLVHSGVAALDIRGDVDGEGVSHTLTLSASTWYEIGCFTQIRSTDTSGNLTLSLQNFSDIVGNTSLTFLEDASGTEQSQAMTLRFDKRTHIIKTLTDTSGNFQITAAANKGFYLDDVFVSKRYGVDVSGITVTAIPTYLPIGIKLPTQTWIDYNDEIIGNPTQCGFFVRFRADFGSTDSNNHFIFSWYDDATGANGFKLFYRASDDKWVFRIRSGGVDNDTFLADSAQVFSSGNTIELSGWYHNGGRLDEKDNTTYYGKLFINKIEIATLTSTITKPAANLNRLRIGSDAPTEGGYGVITLEELGLWVHAPTDEELMSYHDNGFENQNNTLSATVNLALNDILSINSVKMIGEKYTASGNTVEPIAIDGYPPSFKGHDNTESQIVYVTASGTIPKLIFLFRSSWR